eukprot:9482285-Pyramimonas_sp.AAC.1
MSGGAGTRRSPFQSVPERSEQAPRLPRHAPELRCIFGGTRRSQKSVCLLCARRGPDADSTR